MDSDESQPQGSHKAVIAKKAKPLVLPKGKIAMCRDPRVWGRQLPVKPQEYRRFLGLDFSGSTGATFCDVVPGQSIRDAVLIGSQWSLALGQHDTNSLRYVRLKYYLQLTAPDIIFYEEVKYTGPSGMPGNRAAIIARAVSGAQLVHSLCAVMLVWAEQNNIPVQAVPISTLKKYATDRGNANKVDMIKMCNKRFGTDFEPEGYEQTGVDNIADSMFLCEMAVQQYSEVMT